MEFAANKRNLIPSITLTILLICICNGANNITVFATILEDSYPVSKSTATSSYKYLREENSLAINLPSHYTIQDYNYNYNNDDDGGDDANDNSVTMMTGKIMSSQINPNDMNVQKLLLGNFSTSNSGQKLLAEFGVYYPPSTQAKQVKLEQPSAVFRISNLRTSSVQQSSNNAILIGNVDIITKSLGHYASNNTHNIKTTILKTWKNVPATVSIIDQDIGGLFILHLDKSSSASKMISDIPILGTITKKISSASSSSSSTIGGALGAANQNTFANQFNVQKQNSNHAKSITQSNQQSINGDNVNEQDSDQTCNGQNNGCNQNNQQNVNGENRAEGNDNDFGVHH